MFPLWIFSMRIGLLVGRGRARRGHGLMHRKQVIRVRWKVFEFLVSSAVRPVSFFSGFPHPSGAPFRSGGTADPAFCSTEAS